MLTLIIFSYYIDDATGKYNQTFKHFAAYLKWSEAYYAETGKKRKRLKEQRNKVIGS